MSLSTKARGSNLGTGSYFMSRIDAVDKKKQFLTAAELEAFVEVLEQRRAQPAFH